MIRIRLQRRGRRKRPIHHIVVADSRAPRDGKIIENIGRFDNITSKKQVYLNEERAIYWIQKGAQPSDTVRSILRDQGVLYKIHLMNWGKSEEEIEQALAEWREAREAKKGQEPNRKEQQRALLEAEEKEYQKQLQKKAEEAARQKAKEEALATAAEEEAPAEEGEVAEATDTAEASEPEVQKEAEIKPTDEGPAEAEASEEEKAETTETEAGTASEPEVQKEAEKEASEADTKSVDDTEEEENHEETSSQETKTEKPEQGAKVSTDMTAKEAIEHINNTDIEDLKGFISADEDRVTVQRAWESKQEE